MIVALVLFVPGIISSAYYCRLQKISFKTVDFVVFAAIYAFLINMFVIGIYYLLGHASVMTETLFSNIGTIVKYGGLSFVTSIALPNVLLIISKFRKGKKND